MKTIFFRWALPLQFWFASPFEVLLHHNINSYYVIFSILALVVPIVSISLYIYLIPTFEINLQKLNNNSVRNKGNKDKFLDFISNIICSSKDEKVFFKFASKMMKNEREFKLKVYPSLGFHTFLFIFVLFSCLLQF